MWPARALGLYPLTEGPNFARLSGLVLTTLKLQRPDHLLRSTTLFLFFTIIVFKSNYISQLLASRRDLKKKKKKNLKKSRVFVHDPYPNIERVSVQSYTIYRKHQQLHADPLTDEVHSSLICHGVGCMHTLPASFESGIIAAQNTDDSAEHIGSKNSLE